MVSATRSSGCSAWSGGSETKAGRGARARGAVTDDRIGRCDRGRPSRADVARGADVPHLSTSGAGRVREADVSRPADYAERSRTMRRTIFDPTSDLAPMSAIALGIPHV